MAHMHVLVCLRRIKYYLLEGNEHQRRTLRQHVASTCNLLLFGLDKKVVHMT